ncbi:hypothetical protein LguiB_016457 [Lonicera macranthoides]
MDVILCNCGLPVVVRASWTDSNMGRRFRGCQLFGAEVGCGFFRWVDPPMCARALQIILGLLRRITEYEHQIMNSKKREKWLWISLAVAVLIIFVLLCNSASD